MSAGPRYASFAAKALRRAETTDAALRGEARTRRVDAIRLAIQRRARRKRLWRLGVGVALLASAAAAAAAVLVMRGHRASSDSIAEVARGRVYVERNGARESLVSGTKIRSGDHIVVNDGAEVELALAAGTHIALESLTDLSIVSQDRNQVYWLAEGAMHARVAKLQDGHRFIVRTIDAEVEVRGTQFRAATATPDPACGAGTTTRVSVIEGTVTVRHAGNETRVAAGQEWPAGCRKVKEGERDPAPPRVESAQDHGPKPRGRREGKTATAAESPRVQDEPLASGVRARTVNAPPTVIDDSPGEPEKSSVRATSSNLAVQNDLFARATDQNRAGDARSAVATFEHFLTLYPNSELAESAAVERWKLLRQLDPASARAAAEDYLIRYPNGFARRDAHALVGHHE